MLLYRTPKLGCNINDQGVVAAHSELHRSFDLNVLLVFSIRIFHL